MLGWLRRRRLRKMQAMALTRSQAMSARPIRNPSLAWHEDEEGHVVVVLPRRKDFVGKLLAWLFMVPESRPVSLDEIGTKVWHMCDGEHSVHDIAKTLADEYRLTMREAEVSLAEFLRRLGRRGMIALALPKEVADQLTPDQRRALGVVEPEEEQEEPEPSGRKEARPKRRDKDEKGKS